MAMIFPLAEQEDGATLIGGITAHYGQAGANITSVFGNGFLFPYMTEKHLIETQAAAFQDDGQR